MLSYFWCISVSHLAAFDSEVSCVWQHSAVWERWDGVGASRKSVSALHSHATALAFRWSCLSTRGGALASMLDLIANPSVSGVGAVDALRFRRRRVDNSRALATLSGGGGGSRVKRWVGRRGRHRPPRLAYRAAFIKPQPASPTNSRTVRGALRTQKSRCHF